MPFGPQIFNLPHLSALLTQNSAESPNSRGDCAVWTVDHSTAKSAILNAISWRDSPMRTTLLSALLCCSAVLSVAASPQHKILFNRFLSPEIEIMIADTDGHNERVLAPHDGGVIGAEYSPSWSADGQWIVYTQERAGASDIYRIHPDGTGLERLTDDPAFDDQGALSPDGRSLAFVSTRGSGTANLWRLDLATRQCKALTTGQPGNFRPAWSPDGAWIAFSSDRDTTPGVFPGQWEVLQSTGIYIIRPDGSGLRRVTRTGGVAGSPSWSADGKRILYYETDETGAYLAKGGNSRTELVSVDVGTGERKQYTASNQVKLAPKWLSGGRIGYAVRSSLSSTDAASSGIRIWRPDRRVDSVVDGLAHNPSWSPDGGRLVFERVVRRGTTEHLIPTTSHDPEFELYLSEPFASFSVDGRQLVYSQYGNKGLSAGDTSVEIMAADGSGKRTLFHQAGAAAYDATWSPANDTILFSVGRYFRSPGLPAAQIATIKPDGSDFHVVVDDGVNNGFPSWSPDGKQIVYKRGKHLVIRTLADGRTVPLTDGSHYDNFPQWQPHGDRIAFTSDRDGRFELYTIRPDGTDLKRLTNVAGSNAHSSWSPDGKWLVFSSGRKGFKDEMALYDGVPQPYGEIFAMREDGSDVRQLTDNKWEDASAGWAPETKQLSDRR
jgi:Tol biopolymer transport system component